MTGHAYAVQTWEGWPLDDTYPTVRFGVQSNNKMGQLYTGVTERITAINEAYGTQIIAPLSCVHTGYLGSWGARVPFSVTNQWGLFVQGSYTGRVNVTMDDVSAIVRKIAEVYATGLLVPPQELDGTPANGSLSTWYGSPPAGGTVTNPPRDTLAGAMTRLGIGSAYLQVYDPVQTNYVTDGAGFFTVQPLITRAWVIGEVDSRSTTNVPVTFEWGPLHRNPTFYQVDVNPLVRYPVLYWRSDYPPPAGLTVYVAGSVYAISNDSTDHVRYQVYSPFATSYSVPAASLTLTGDRWYSVTNMTLNIDPTNYHDTVQIAYPDATTFGADATADALSHSTPAPVFGFAFTNVFNECQALIDNMVAFIGPEGYWTNSNVYGHGEQGADSSTFSTNVVFTDPGASQTWWNAWGDWDAVVTWMPSNYPAQPFPWPSWTVDGSLAVDDFGATNNRAPELIGTLSWIYGGNWLATWINETNGYFHITGSVDYNWQWTGTIFNIKSKYVAICPTTTQHSVELYCVLGHVTTNEQAYYPPVWVWTSSETISNRVISSLISADDVAARTCVLSGTGTYTRTTNEFSSSGVTVDESYMQLDDGADWGSHINERANIGVTTFGPLGYTNSTAIQFLFAPGAPAYLYLSGTIYYLYPDGGAGAWSNELGVLDGKATFMEVHTPTAWGSQASVVDLLAGIGSSGSNWIVRPLPPVILLNGPNGLLYLER